MKMVFCCSMRTWRGQHEPRSCNRQELSNKRSNPADAAMSVSLNRPRPSKSCLSRQNLKPSHGNTRFPVCTTPSGIHGHRCDGRTCGPSLSSKRCTALDLSAALSRTSRPALTSHTSHARLTLHFNHHIYRLAESLADLLPGLTVGGRVRLLPEADARRGTVSYTGLVPEIPGIGAWVGVTLDEPTGKNDGSVKGKRYFQCGSNCGVFVRPERCEAGDFPVLDEFDEDLEEL